MHWEVWGVLLQWEEPSDHRSEVSQGQANGEEYARPAYDTEDQRMCDLRPACAWEGLLVTHPKPRYLEEVGTLSPSLVNRHLPWLTSSLADHLQRTGTRGGVCAWSGRGWMGQHLLCLLGACGEVQNTEGLGAWPCCFLGAPG